MNPPRIMLAVTGVMIAITVALVGCAAPPSTGPALSPQAPKGGDSMFSISSPAFEGGGMIPSEMAMKPAGGSNVSIPFEWRGAPASTKSFALALVDLAPVAHGWVHWLVVDIPPTTTALPRGASGTSAMPSGSRELANTFGFLGYGGPQPPAGTGNHEYRATLYALDASSVPLPAKPSFAQFQSAIAGHVLAQTSVSGLYGR